MYSVLCLIVDNQLIVELLRLIVRRSNGLELSAKDKLRDPANVWFR